MQAVLSPEPSPVAAADATRRRPALGQVLATAVTAALLTRLLSCRSHRTVPTR